MKLILCCDYGLDDAAATADVFAHARADGYEEIVLVAVGGNVPADVSLRNAKKLVAALAPEVPVRLVDTADEPQPAEFLTAIHGGDGMGDLFADAPCGAPVQKFADWAKSLEEGFTLLSLGPMTLVGRLLEKRPLKFIFMGGNIAETPNFHGYEFNHALNRTAFSECVQYPHVAVTMDTCRHPLLNIQNIELKGETVLSRIVARSRALTFTSGEKGCYVWDDIAVKYLRHPNWFQTYSARDRDGNLLTVARYIHGQPYPAVLEE